MQLKPGWQLLEEALLAVLDPGLMEYHPEEVKRRLTVLRANLIVRVNEIIPKDKGQLVDMVAEAGAIVSPEWPKEVYEFVMNHGGPEAIERFIAQNPTWQHCPCPCGCGAMVVIQSDHLEIILTSHEEMKTFLSVFLLGQIMKQESTEPDVDEQPTTEDPNGATAA